MTSHCYTLSLDDAQASILQEALTLMSHHCANEIAKGSGAPFHAWSHSVDQVIQILSNARGEIYGSYPVTGPPVEDQLEIWNTKTQPSPDD